MQVSAQPAPKFDFLAARWTRWLPVVVVVAASLLLTLPLWQTRFMWTADGRLHMLRIFESTRRCGRALVILPAGRKIFISVMGIRSLKLLLSPCSVTIWSKRFIYLDRPD